jgi:hypothetical protein
MTYLSKATDKYPIQKVRVTWDNIGSNDLIAYRRAYAAIDTESVSIYGILDAKSCIGKDSVAGEKALFQVFRKTKKEWNKDEKKWESVEVGETESYLYNRLKADIEASQLEQFAVVIEPLVPNSFFKLLAKGTGNFSEDVAAQLVETTVIVGEPTGEELTAEDLKALDGSADNGKKQYAPKESESDILEARKKFLMQQLGLEPETTVRELAAITLSIPENAPNEEVERKLVAEIKEIVFRLIGG